MDRRKTLNSVTACTTCEGTGWAVRKTKTLSEVTPCPECRPQARTAALVDKAAIPPRYFDRGFDVYSLHHPLQERALKRAIEFVEEFPRVERGLLFVGPCGVGKTHLSVAVLRSLIEEKQVQGRFVDETELLRRLQYSYQPDSPETEKEVMLPLMQSDLLVWDDLGTGRPTEWVKETIRTVINHRYTYKKATVFTTNRSVSAPFRPAEENARASSIEGTLLERVGTHLYSRILEMCEILEIKGPDARTEIHKARYDFRKTQVRLASPGEQGSPEILSCPACQSREVIKQDSSDLKKGPTSSFIELACLCRACGKHFVAKHYADSGALEYFEPGV